MTNAPIKTWKYALVQHPMWLLIAEDMVCAERTPPWGCGSLDEYAERIDICLNSLEKFPQLHLNFDFSAVEFEDMAERYPNLMPRIRKLSSEGRISYVNGTYSQPHLQILSIESAIRQFQYGLKSIKQLVDYTITSYSAQEPGLTPQVPQILRAFGFDTSSGPSFPYGVKLHGGHVQHWGNDWEWVHGDDVVNWLGLDGSRIPFWMTKSHAPDDGTCVNEAQHGTLDHTRLRADIVDMVEVNNTWIRRIEVASSWARLDRTLTEMVQKEPPTTDAEIDANYAYIEGVDAESLSRANTMAETALLSLEAIEAMFGADGLKSFDYDWAWKNILKAQHHDSYWTGGPELRAKSIIWCDEAADAANERIEEVAGGFARNLPTADKRSILVLHPYARPHKIPVTIVSGLKSRNTGAIPELTDVSLTSSNGKRIPSQTRTDFDGSRGVVFVSSAKGLGYETIFAAKGGKSATKESAVKKEHRFKNKFYSITTRPNGGISSLKPSGAKDLLDKSDIANLWQRREEDVDILAQVSGDCLLSSGPVFSLVEAPVVVGAIKMTSRLTLYKELPWFTVETELDFTEPIQFGDYFDDITKLHYAWPVGKDARIRHAIGGCPSVARPKRTFFVSPWLNVTNSRAGAAFCLFNSARCWLDGDGFLRFVVAWSHDGERFHNRQGPLPGIMGPMNWIKPMDLLIRGKHVIKYAVWPHNGKLTDGDVADWAASMLMPPIAVPVETGGGSQASHKTFLGLTSPGVVPLSVRFEDNAAVLRAVETNGQTARLKLGSEADWKVTEPRNLDGRKARNISPHKIIEIELRR